MADLDRDGEDSQPALAGPSLPTRPVPEAMFRGLLEFAPDAIVIIDVSGAIRLMNSEAEKMFGYERGELIGRAIETLLPDRLREVHIGHRESYFAQPRTRPMGASLDLAARRRDGSEFPVEISLSPLKTEEGLLVTSVIRDITERRRTQTELEFRARQQAIVAELGRRALLGTDPALLIEEAVAQVAETLTVDFARVLERSADGASFRHSASFGWEAGLVGQQVAPAAALHAGYAIQRGEALTVLDLAKETRFGSVLDLGEWGITSVAAVLIYVENRPYGVLEVMSKRLRDFSRDDVHFLQATANVLSAAVERTRVDRLQRERDFLRAEQMLAVGQVAAGVAHELRNPLTSIKGLIQVNLREAEARGLPTEDLNVIEQEIRRMERSLRAFLDFARPPEPDRHRQGFAALVERTVALIRGRADQQGVTLSLSLPAEGVLTDVDADQMQQLLLNLALNALDAMPRGGVLGVALLARSGGGMELSVFDSGPGVAPDLLPRVFEPFVSGKPTGLGLGLAVSRRVAEDHGGSLVAENRPEGGARFILRLPAAASV